MQIDIFHSNVVMQEQYTLYDIANIYTWRRVFWMLFSLLFISMSFYPITYLNCLKFIWLLIFILIKSYDVSLNMKYHVQYSSNSTWLDSTRLDTFDVSSPCIWLCRASRRAQLDTSSSTGSTCRARLARHVELDRRYLQLSYDHSNSYCLISYSLINWSIH